MLIYNARYRQGCALSDSSSTHIFDTLGWDICSLDRQPDITINGVFVKAVSVLSSANYVELVLFDSNGFTKFRVDTRYEMVAQSIMQRGNLIRYLMRKGIVSGVRFVQSIFVYAHDTDLNAIVGHIPMRRI